MKLYATINSERGGRPAKKGGDKSLMIDISRGNYHLGTLKVYDRHNGYDIYFNGIYIQGGDDEKQAKT